MNLRTLEITTRIGCKNNCVYCPQQVLVNQYFKRSDEYILLFETFKRCLKTVPKDVRIDFSGLAEPWLNPDCTKMLLYAFYQQKYQRIAVFTTAVGMQLKDVEMIKKIPFNIFVLHLADRNQYAKINVDNHYLKVLTALKNSGIKMSYMVMGKLHPALIPIFGEKVHSPKMISRAGNLKSFKISVRKGKIACGSPYGLHHNVLLPNGDVILCCMDYGLKHVLGNLLTDSYDDLFHKEAFQRILYLLENEKNGNAICRNCEEAVTMKGLLLLKIKRIITQQTGLNLDNAITRSIGGLILKRRY